VVKGGRGKRKKSESDDRKKCLIFFCIFFLFVCCFYCGFLESQREQTKKRGPLVPSRNIFPILIEREKKKKMTLTDKKKITINTETIHSMSTTNRKNKRN